jgi:glycine dehydrogenase subunit 2
MPEEGLIFERETPGGSAAFLPTEDGLHEKAAGLLKGVALRSTPPGLPEVTESAIARHFTRLSQRNFGVDLGFYPLGSCTMKYNPKVHEQLARLPGLACIHPSQHPEQIQGMLGLLWELQEILLTVSGMDAITLQPPAGAAGEHTALLCFRAYHRSRGDLGRTRIIVPDSSHGTNPASATRCGMSVETIPSNPRGLTDLPTLKNALDDKVAGLMLTNPNTVGLFEEQVVEICKMVHEAGALVYCDGANMNAIAGIVRPGDLGFDAMHFNTHKTFSTPHGGGGPGSGPVAVKSILEPFLPVPRIERKEDGSFDLGCEYPQSVGMVHGHLGNIGVLVRAYAYLVSLGPEGLRTMTERAVLNANYLLSRLRADYKLAYESQPMHEFVISAEPQKALGCRALDIAKRLLDYGFHPPTIYFPLIVSEAMMVEPTETESKATLDAFAEAMVAIARECEESPDLLHEAPRHAFCTRLDEATAARRPDVRYRRAASEGS